MTTRYQYPSPEETMKHPGYPSAIWSLEPHQRGILPCAKDRGGPVNISWEIHGDGPRRIVLIMGLGGLATSWQRQTKHFGHDLGDAHSVLLIDNRGIGLSDVPTQRYTTSQMALDIHEVLQHLGWLSAPRSLHLCGISLGGMIAQELACLVPDRLASLTLLCTSPDMETLKTLPFVLWQRIGMLKKKPLDEEIINTGHQIFTQEWLAAPDEAKELPVPGETPRCGPPRGSAADAGENKYHTFESNFQRFQAQELSKRLDRDLFSVKGFLLQLGAAALHQKSPKQLGELADKVGRERIAVVHGTRDNMIDVKFGRRLIELLQPGVGLIVDDFGHAPVMENVDWFKKFFTERLELGEELNRTSVA